MFRTAKFGQKGNISSMSFYNTSNSRQNTIWHTTIHALFVFWLPQLASRNLVPPGLQSPPKEIVWNCQRDFIIPSLIQHRRTKQIRHKHLLMKKHQSWSKADNVISVTAKTMLVTEQLVDMHWHWLAGTQYGHLLQLTDLHRTVFEPWLSCFETAHENGQQTQYILSQHIFGTTQVVQHTQKQQILLLSHVMWQQDTKATLAEGFCRWPGRPHKHDEVQLETI